MERSYIFDIGRVLADFDFDRALKRLEKYSPYESGEMGERIFAQRTDGGNPSIDYESGRIDSSEFYREIKERARLDIDYGNFAEIWSDIFSENVKISDFLKSIENCPKVIVSNLCLMHWEKLAGLSNINRFFAPSRIIKSYEVGVRKPGRRIYEKAILLLPPDSEIVYFDDVEEYVRVAREMGIKGIKYDCRDDDIDLIVKKYDLLK